MCHTLGGGQHQPPRFSPELKSLLLPNSQPLPWETLVVVYRKQPQPAMPKGGRGKLRLLFLNTMLWAGVFLSPQGFKGFVTLPLGFASKCRGHAGRKSGFIDQVFSL